MVRTDRMAAIRDAWIAIGLSVEPADRARAEAGVRLAYRRAGLSDTVRIIWTASPMSGAGIADSLLRRSTRPRTSVDVGRPIADLLHATVQRIAPDEALTLRLELVDPIATHVTEGVWRPIRREIARVIGQPAPAFRIAYGQH